MWSKLKKWFGDHKGEIVRTAWTLLVDFITRRKTAAAKVVVK